MASFKNDKGLTLIELLITISVLAVVSAIALPVINNVVTSSNSNAYNQTLKDAQAFIDRYSKGGVVVYDGLRTLAGYVDKDGDNKIEADEKIDTLTLDSKYAMSVTGSASEGGSYTSGGVTAATITVAGSGSAATPSGYTYTLTVAPQGDPASDLGGSGSCNVSNWNAPNDLLFYCFSGASSEAQAAFASLAAGDTIEVTIFDWSTNQEVTNTYTVSSVSTAGFPVAIYTNETVAKGEIRGLRM